MIQFRQKSRSLLILAESLAQIPNSAGIIDNNTNEVLFRNPASLALFNRWRRQFKCETPKNTNTTHDTQVTIAQVKRLREITLPIDSCRDYIEKRYVLHFDRVGEILAVDRFYFFKFGLKGCRVWVNQSWSYQALSSDLQFI